MEPSGRNTRQPVATGAHPGLSNLPESIASSCHQKPGAAHGKEGVDGSSPSEGFASPLLISSFLFRVSQR